ncbi:hypothetical protein Syun_010175 [Stephania yunnanensis]|uniref:Uncharacterized protein n=1 Tax=Stephania yunnanensis TaxID=152371 RepID=A0AAP0KFY1_9MAGN
MAGMDVLCSDKTDTLTLNKLTVDKNMIKTLRLQKETTKRARHLVVWGIEVEASEQRSSGAGKILASNSQILNLASNKSDIERMVHASNDKFACTGLRSLGVAYHEVPDGTKVSPGGPWEFVSIFPLFDPPRHDSAETIRKALDLGVSVKMITGDQLAIAKETGMRLGMGANMYLSTSLLGEHKDGSISKLPIDELIEKADGFAGVFPAPYKTINTNHQFNNLIDGAKRPAVRGRGVRSGGGGEELETGRIGGGEAGPPERPDGRRSRAWEKERGDWSTTCTFRIQHLHFMDLFTHTGTTAHSQSNQIVYLTHLAYTTQTSAEVLKISFLMPLALSPCLSLAARALYLASCCHSCSLPGEPLALASAGNQGNAYTKGCLIISRSSLSTPVLTINLLALTPFPYSIADLHSVKHKNNEPRMQNVQKYGVAVLHQLTR